MGVGGSSFIEEMGFSGCTVSSLWFVGSLLWPVGAFFSFGMRASSRRPLEHTGSAAAARGLRFPQHVGSWFPNQRLSSCPLHWKVDSQPPDHQGSPGFIFLICCLILNTQPSWNSVNWQLVYE